MAVAVLTDAVDFSNASISELSDALMQMHGLECATRSAMLSVVAAVDSFNSYLEDGCKSLVDWICLKLFCGRSDAHEIERVAKAVVSLPHISAAFAQGRLSWKQLCLITRFADSSTDEELAATGSQYSLGQLQKMARDTDEAPAKNTDDAHKARYLRFRRRGQEMFLEGRMPVESGEVLFARLDKMADRLGIDPITGLYPPRVEAHLDALIELADTAGGSNKPSKPSISIVVTAEELIAEDGKADLAAKAVISSETARRLSCDSLIELVTVDKYNQVVGIGYQSRNIPHRLERYLRDRDQGCRFPCCERDTWTHGHHIEHWTNGGPTNVNNLIELCPIHHHLVHEAGWVIEGNPEGQVSFISPDGKVLVGPEPLRPEVKERFIELLEPVLS